MKSVTPRIYGICGLVLIIGVTLSFVVYFAFEGSNKQKKDKILSSNFATIHNQIQQEIDRNLNSLFALRANYKAHRGMSRAEFNSYANYYTSNIKSIQALEWVPAISLHQRDSFELAGRLEGFTNFQIKTTIGDSVTRAESRPMYFPIYFIAPFEGNEVALGFDPGKANATRQNTIDQAIATGTAVASDVMTIIQKSDSQQAILVFVPIFKDDKAGIDNIIGLVEGVYLIDNLIESAISSIDLPDSVNIIIKNSNGDLMFGKEPTKTKSKKYDSKEGKITIANQTWDLQIIYLGNFNLPFIRPIWLFFVSLIFTMQVVKVVYDTLTHNRRALRKHVKELEKKNQDLEQYAYAVSHDLQEPLHSMQSLINLLNLEYKSKLDDMGQQYLSYILDSSNRMRTLITNLLNYGRLGQEEVNDRVNTEAILDKVKQDLFQIIEKSETQIIKKTPLPTLKAYPTALHQLFQNLISNAIKFQPKGNKPIIEISAKWENNRWFFIFKDNGIGIPKEFQKDIFVIFRRLHNNSEYSGTGVGLANCKKIVSLHNGKIWIESEKGQGSTFFFTLNL
ncbi:CHASE domain-containing protein [Reichenbachiella sp. MALMAid0571]|uniref:CHASE domain-containing protein n=1 Tax=Reichenbachiella sp. MALMAid0571 TaxID=3143939 RepID=UPI0032DEEB42